MSTRNYYETNDLKPASELAAPTIESEQSQTLYSAVNLTESPVDSIAVNAVADSYENDNSRFRAKNITVGSTQSRSIHTAGDVDWIKFTVSQDGFYSLVTSGGDTILDMYTIEGQYFGRNDDKGNYDYGSIAVVQLYANTSYYAKVTGYGSSTFNYTISLSRGIVSDAYETNNDNSRTSTYTQLTVGSCQTHTIHTASDVDWMKVNFSSSGYYTFTVAAGDRDASAVTLELYDVYGNYVWRGSGNTPSCFVEGSAGDSYYVKVSSASGVASGAYQIAVSACDLSDTSFDDYEVDDDMADATVLTMSSSQTSVSQNRSLTLYLTDDDEVIADTDWISFTPTVTGLYSFRVSGTTAITNLDVWSYAAEDDISLPVGGAQGINPYVENYLIAGNSYYIRISSDYADLNIPSYTFTTTRLQTYTGEQDAYENDNTMSAAKVLTLGSTQAHSLHSTTDVDWMKFTPTTSGYYTFYTGARNGNAGDADILLALYDASGRLLIYDDDGFTGYNAKVSYNLTAGTTYYLRAESAIVDEIVPYYTVSVASGIIEDTYDVYMDERSILDNTRQDATYLALNDSQSHSIHSSSDVDWVYMRVDRTGYYTIQTEGSGDTIISLYDANGNYLTMNDDSGIGRNASLTVQLRAGTTYYAEVESYNNSLIPDYTLTLTEYGGSRGDAYESDNTFSSAKDIVAGETQAHSIHSAGDVDWVHIRPIASGAYQIQTSGEGDMKLELYSSDGHTLLATDDDSGVGLNARIGYNLSANTDYYIKAYTYNSSTLVDEYGLSVALMAGSDLGDEYENDNSPTSAKAITVGTTQTHSIHTANDVDWVTFTPSVSAEYTIQTVGSGLNCDTQLYLYSSLADAQANRYLQWDDDSGTDRNARISRVLTAGTTYYIKARAWDTYTIPSYGLKVSQNNGVGSDNEVNGDEYENDNTSGICKPIAVGREYTHSIHVQSDTDWVRFFTHHTGTYTIQTTGDSDMSFIIYKREPGGPLVPYEGGSEITSGGSRENAKYTCNLEADNWYYVRVTTDQRRTTSPSYGIRVDLNPSSVSGDPYETAGGKRDDNAPSRATWLTTNQIQIHSIHAGGDVDFYSIKVATTGSYVISSERNDLYIYAYEQQRDGSLQFLERYQPMGEDTAFGIDLKGNTTYYFKVAALTNQRTVESYQIAISNPRDSYEDDDTSAKATTLAIGTSQSHTLHFNNDVDWVKFTISSAQAGKYIIENNNGGAIKMTLYRSQSGSNTLVGESSSSMSYTLSAGTYYLRMGSNNGNCNDSYSVLLQKDTTIAPDPNEPDDTMASAKQLTVGGSSQSFNLHTATDVDYVKFYATAGNRYTVSSTQGNVSVQILNSSGSVLGSSSGVSAVPHVDITQSGYYYARISSANAQPVETYTLQCTSTPINKAENYVVLFNGGGDKASNYGRYAGVLKDIYRKLVALGVPASHIYILNADGTNSAPDMNQGSSLDPRFVNTDWSAELRQGSTVMCGTLSDLRSVINTIDAKMDSDDHFLMITSDHGYAISHELVGWDRSSISPSQLNSAVSCLTTGYQTYLFAQCHSGHMLNGLSTGSGYGTRYGMASAAETESSYSSTTQGFGYDFLNALNRYGLSMTTSQMSQYMLENGSFVCHDTYSDNEECVEHWVSTFFGRPTGCQHTWDKGSNFQVLAQS